MAGDGERDDNEQSDGEGREDRPASVGWVDLSGLPETVIGAVTLLVEQAAPSRGSDCRPCGFGREGLSVVAPRIGDKKQGSGDREGGDR
ncbi:hypothetical protein [Flexivirga caeni]|uniref:Uncharacterized protein n=1 Tax=Flexivirga caeni TaxID=2294115 RepID=A0A3M9LWQ2_9MICO|nr:hypothetical protein [Flexivirga caeni]RNI17750.1 hypothetical protein EFY87_19320 [Flexivirga caeni]